MFVIVMVIFLMIQPHDYIPMWLPLAFLGCLSLTHVILGVYSRHDSQISQIILSTLKILGKKIPRKLRV